MTRAELLKSPEYWKARIQIALYNCAESFMKKTHKNRKQLAEHLGVSNGYVTQLLNGDYDHKLSKIAELSLAFGFIPYLEFIPVEQYITSEQNNLSFKCCTEKSLYYTYKEKFKGKTNFGERDENWCITIKQKEVA